MEIKGFLEIINSKRDVYGNCYYAFRYADADTGKEVCGTISGGESNVYAAKRYLFEDSNMIRAINTELKIREFNRLTKTWKYAGCPPEEIADFIKRGINGTETLVSIAGL
jgi:hypothetical protein